MPNPEIIASVLVGQSLRKEMLDLHCRHFDGVSEDKFMRDLDEKDWVIILRDQARRVAGFSTQKIISGVPGTDGAKFLFSGDTIVSPDHWDTPYLSGCFGHLMLRLIAENPKSSLFWFLISKSFRTYRFMPVFFNRFWPHPDSEAPPEIARMLNAVATWKFGNRYVKSKGLVVDPEGDRLTTGLAGIPERRKGDKFTLFFTQRNPGFASGDELACIAPIEEQNLNALARCVIVQTSPIWIQ